MHFKLPECCGLDMRCPLKWLYLWTLGSQMVELSEKVVSNFRREKLK